MIVLEQARVFDAQSVRGMEHDRGRANAAHGNVLLLDDSQQFPRIAIQDRFESDSIDLIGFSR